MAAGQEQWADIEGPLGAEVDAFIEQRGPHLGRGHVDEPVAVQHVEDRLLLLGAQGTRLPTDQAVAQLAGRIGVRDACVAVSASQAGYYRRHRVSPPPERPAPIPHRQRPAVQGKVRRPPSMPRGQGCSTEGLPRRRVDGGQGYRQPMGAWSLTWASGSINGEGPLSEEAAVRVRDQEVRACGLHSAAGVVASAKVGILTARFPTVVIPSVLENQGSAWIADTVGLVVPARNTTVHVTLGSELDRHGYRIHRCRHTVERLLREVDEHVVVPVQRRRFSSVRVSDGRDDQRGTCGKNAYRQSL
jgi:hypothetical protein